EQQHRDWRLYPRRGARARVRRRH
ncbi:hypothetical protein BN1708_020619, partial [Verticillium longisporum]